MKYTAPCWQEGCRARAKLSPQLGLWRCTLDHCFHEQDALLTVPWDVRVPASAIRGMALEGFDVSTYPYKGGEQARIQGTGRAELVMLAERFEASKENRKGCRVAVQRIRQELYRILVWEGDTCPPEPTPTE